MINSYTEMSQMFLNRLRDHPDIIHVSHGEDMLAPPNTLAIWCLNVAGEFGKQWFTITDS